MYMTIYITVWQVNSNVFPSNVLQDLQLKTGTLFSNTCTYDILYIVDV